MEEPGWKLGWAWKGDEVIWAMLGAEAKEQGNCTRFRGQQKPHCCKKEPVIIDLMPGTPYNMQTANCCKGGVLTSLKQDHTKRGATFQMNYAKPSLSASAMPENFTLGIPGYSCGTPFQVPPTKFTKDGHRWQQVLGQFYSMSLGTCPKQSLFCWIYVCYITLHVWCGVVYYYVFFFLLAETWNVTCIYSQFLASPAPKCCVSLSAFYNSTIVHCPTCSCNCRGLPGATCVE